MTILFISGVNDRSEVGVNLDERGNLVYLMDGNASIQYRLPLKEGAAWSFVLFGLGVKQHSAEFETPPSLVFNQISDADTHKGALERCDQFCSQLSALVINHPKHIQQTARDQVSSNLQGIRGVIMPRTRRFRPRSPEEVLSFAQSENIDFPYIARVAGDHRGKSMIRLDRREDYTALHALPFDGRDFYITEFVDYRSEDGYYHKQRIVVIDGEPILRHSLFLNHWMVHANSRAFMMERESWDDDMARFNRLSQEVMPKLKPAIDEITKRLQLEYYGIDCHLRDNGQMLIFEANANMNVLEGTNPKIRYRREAIEQKLYALLTKYSGERVI